MFIQPVISEMERVSCVADILSPVISSKKKSHLIDSRKDSNVSNVFERSEPEVSELPQREILF